MEHLMENDLPNQCSNITAQNIHNMNWIRVAIAISGFVIVVLMLVALLIRREFKSALERQFIYLLLATLFREAVLLSNINYQFEEHFNDTTCSILGAFNLYTAVLVIIYIASTIFYLLSRVTGGQLVTTISKDYASAFELGFIIATFFLPLLISVGLLYTNIFGFSTAWCWMQEYDSECNKTNLFQKIFAGYSFLIITGILSIILSTAITIIGYKIARKIKKARHLIIQALILCVCLIINVVILTFAAIVVNLPVATVHVNLRIGIQYAYTVVISLYDIVYPLGFLLSVKHQAIFSSLSLKKRRSEYISLSKGNTTFPASDRVSARSTTVPVTTAFTGEFTTITDPGV